MAKVNHNHQQSSEDHIMRHLVDDFQVEEFLRFNQGDGKGGASARPTNSEQYLQLWDLLKVESIQKQGLKLALGRSLDAARRENDSHEDCVAEWRKQSLILSKMSQQGEKTVMSENELEALNAIKNNFSLEHQTKRSLLKEITQMNKSLTLLKGDIGHLIDRNQSAKIMESKIAKVKIVAQDQLKRVQLAFSKDKEEEKIRIEMQRKFNKSLKKMASSQDTSLKKSLTSYVDAISRWETLNGKFTQNQKIAPSQSRNEDMLRKIETLNSNYDFIYSQIRKVCKYLDEKEENQQAKVAIPTIQLTAQRLIGKYSQLTHEIDNLGKMYRSKTKQVQYSKETIKVLNNLEAEVETSKAEEATFRYRIDPASIEENDQVAKRLRKNATIILKMLQFIHPRMRINGTNHCETLIQNHKQFLECDSKILGSGFEDLHSDLKRWIKCLPLVLQAKVSFVTRENHHHDDFIESEDKDDLINDEEPEKHCELSHKLEMSERQVQSQEPRHAQRIQLLENVDRDYYKMLKMTLRMEKENTCKNYHFLRNFKRTKYASRDKILQQKRFQASLSCLFVKSRRGSTADKQNITGSRKSSLKQTENFSSLFQSSVDQNRIVENNADKKLPSKSLFGQNTCHQLQSYLSNDGLTDRNSMKESRAFKDSEPSKESILTKKSRFLKNRILNSPNNSQPNKTLQLNRELLQLV